MDNSNVAELQGQTVEQITGQLPTLDRAALVELQAAETAAPNPRTTLLAAIDSALQALDDDGGDGGDGEKNPSAVGDAAGKPAAQAAGKLGKAHWQHPEYHGPLTGDQAAWRLANTAAAKDAPAPNTKPVRTARTK